MTDRTRANAEKIKAQAERERVRLLALRQRLIDLLDDAAPQAVAAAGAVDIGESLMSMLKAAKKVCKYIDQYAPVAEKLLAKARERKRSGVVVEPYA